MRIKSHAWHDIHMAKAVDVPLTVFTVHVNPHAAE